MQGEAGCADWGLQTGGQSGGRRNFFFCNLGVWLLLQLLILHITGLGFPGEK